MGPRRVPPRPRNGPDRAGRPGGARPAVPAGLLIRPPAGLLLKGTPFQLQVWEALLRIPEGRVLAYGDLARRLGDLRAGRAVGAAVGRNPVGYLIPCHRVIQASGALGGYHWGTGRKRALLALERARREQPVVA